MKYITLPLLLCLALMSSAPLWAQAEKPLEIVARYLNEHRSELKLTEADLADYEVKNMVVSQHNGLTHVYLQQRHEGIAVRNAILNLNIMENGKVLSVGNRFVPDLASKVNTKQPQLSMEAAVQSLLRHTEQNASVNLQISKRISEHEAEFSPLGIALEPIVVHLAYQPAADKTVRLAWNVTFYELGAQHWWDARIDALTGEVLDLFDQVLHCDFGVPHQGCAADHGSFSAPFAAPAPEAVQSPEDGSAYRVFPLTVESPNHGDRLLFINPADSTASPNGWHDTDGVPGPEYTITRGNNVHAYHDIFNLNQSIGDEPDGGEALQFDFPLDLSSNRPYTQIDPLVTNLFYWNNIMHDIWHHYGFDEASGNFQETNYTGMGVGGDYVRAEALDGSGTNNANFATPADGNRPRMQMYLWGGSLPSFDTNARLTIRDTAGNARQLAFVQGGFGGPLPDAATPLSAELVLVEDEAAPTTDGCEDLVNASAIAGKIAIIDRGACEFGFKVLNAEQAGAVAAIICNNVEGAPIVMGAGAVGNQASIPSVMISLADCLELKALLPGAIAELSAPDLSVPTPGPTGRSSDLDNGVIVHEYTHGISIRLTGGAGSSGCLGNFEQAGEGWSDWYGLVMTTTADMTAEQRRGIGTYASGQSPTGGGIRTYPYSRSMEVNPHTYANINGVSVPHGVGSVWCVMIWDMFWNLVDEYGYDEDLIAGTGGNNMAMQLVTDGLKLQPCSPTFLDSRDAILAADLVNYDGANQCLIWETFARRGLGASAQPGGNEAFDLPDACNFTFRVKKTGMEEAFAGGVVDYQLDITNGRTVDVENGQLTDLLPEGASLVEGSSNCQVSEQDGRLIFDLGDVQSGALLQCNYQLQLAEAPFSYTTAKEDAEEGLSSWNIDSPVGTANWAISSTDAYTGNASFFARNLPTATEQNMALISAWPKVGEFMGLSFWHRYNTEEGWDGGIVEVSPNGVLWLDGTRYIIKNDYNTTLDASVDHALSGRRAFSGNSNGWIETVLDLSEVSAWPRLFVRFRFVSDDAVGAEGWYVDDINFLGNFHKITNIACVGEGEEALCDEVVTVVYGDPATSTRSVQAEAIGLSVSPNPTNGQVQLQLEQPQSGLTELQVLSVDGKQLLSRRYDAFQTELLDLSAYGPGVYLLRISTGRGVATKRVVVQ